MIETVHKLEDILIKYHIDIITKRSLTQDVYIDIFIMINDIIENKIIIYFKDVNNYFFIICFLMEFAKTEMIKNIFLLFPDYCSKRYLNFKSDLYKQILKRSLSYSNDNILETLLQLDFNPNTKNDSYLINILSEASNISETKALLLLKYGADPNIKDIKDLYTLSPLMLASKHNYEILLKTILEMGVDPNETNKLGITALSYTANTSIVKLNIIKTLLEYKANPNTICENSFYLIFKYIDQNDSNIESIINLLIEYKVNLEVKNEYGMTPILMAAYIKRLNIVNHLINCNVNILARDNCNNTILHLILNPFKNETEGINIIKRLIKMGLSVDYKNNNNLSFMDLLKKYKSKSFYKEIKKYNINLKNKNKSKLYRFFHGLF
jgi:ankyrin repeat protein